jgi:penicillin-binding protein 2
MNRQLLFHFFFLAMGLAFLIRLFQIQVLDDSYKIAAENNATRKMRQYAPRGYIYDRNNKLIVSNQIAYDLMVIPRQIKDLDTVLLCELLQITREDFDKQLNKAKTYSTYKPSVFHKLISAERFAEIQEQLFQFTGFFTQKRLLRKYQYLSAANVVGYIGEVSPAYIQSHPQYKMGDLIGKSGLDFSYENELRGKAGIKYVMVDNHNREKGPFMEGKYDTIARPGYDLQSSLDIDLQQFGEYLMHGKRGGIVAIDPKTGEILALVTSPNFDPNLLIGSERNKNYNMLDGDAINKPLYDRSILAEYPPGSPFKLMNALVALQEGVITTETEVSCHHGYHAGGVSVACHCGGGTFSLIRSISKSCNAYYCTIFRRIIDKYPDSHYGLDVWAKHVKSFGLGTFLGSDLPTGRKGLVPTSDYYNKVYKGWDGWGSLTIVSLGIGQGELLVTPIQLANFAAIIANRGYYYTPHLIRKIGGKPITDTTFTKRRYTTVAREHFHPVVEGMYQVFESGTARGSRLEGLPMCGKTGTAENPHGQDHSIFLAFAPKDEPKIAIAIFVENGYWGSRWAGPIASLMMEKYITGKVTRPQMVERMYNGTLYEEYKAQLRDSNINDSLFVPYF